jgi:hypothetical protein
VHFKAFRSTKGFQHGLKSQSRPCSSHLQSVGGVHEIAAKLTAATTAATSIAAITITASPTTVFGHHHVHHHPQSPTANPSAESLSCKPSQ